MKFLYMRKIRIKNNITVVIPSYREFKTIPLLIKKIRKILPGSKVIIVDDSPKDQNSVLKKLLKAEKNTKVISRLKKLGRGSAVIQGLRSAFHDSETKFFFEMDSDFAHDPVHLNRFMKKIESENLDTIIGSRNLKGGKIIGVSLTRKILSFLINKFLRVWLSVRVSDFTGGFRLYNRRAVKFLINQEFESSGFITLSEIIYKLNMNRYRIGEVPVTITERKFGKSNVSLRELFISLLFVLKMRVKKVSFRKDRINKLFFLTVIILLAFSIRYATINRIGRTWDEPEYIEQGYKMIELIKKGDFSNSFFYTTYDHPPLAKYLYGISAHLDVEKFAKDGAPIFKYDYTYSRLFSIVFAVIAVVFVFLIGWEFVSPFVGVVSGIIFSTLPFFVGLSQLVTTESLLMLFFTSGVYFFLKLIQKYYIRKVIVTGIIFGLALLTKQSNFLMVPIFLIIYFLWFIQQKKCENLRFINDKSISIFYIAVIGIFIFVVLWPMPYFHLNEVLAINQKFWGVKTSPPEVFFGRLVLVPVVYYPVLFAITTPLLIFIFFLIGLKVIDVKKNWVFYSILAWFLFPFIQSFYPWRQHGVRYIIEIYAPLSLISALGIQFITEKISKKISVKSVSLFVLTIYMLVILYKINPYYLDYFNSLVGGINGVYEKRTFQIGWWGQGLREAGLYIENNASEGSSVGLAISPPHTFPPLEKLKVSKYKRGNNYDYVIINYYNITREGFDDSEIKREYILVHQVLADKAPLVSIYKNNKLNTQ